MRKIGYLCLILLGMVFTSCYDAADEITPSEVNQTPVLNGQDDDDPIPPPPPPPPPGIGG